MLIEFHKVVTAHLNGYLARVGVARRWVDGHLGRRPDNLGDHMAEVPINFGQISHTVAASTAYRSWPIDIFSNFFELFPSAGLSLR